MMLACVCYMADGMKCFVVDFVVYSICLSMSSSFGLVCWMLLAL